MGGPWPGPGHQHGIETDLPHGLIDVSDGKAGLKIINDGLRIRSCDPDRAMLSPLRAFKCRSARRRRADIRPT